MSYLEKAIGPNETLLHKAKVHWIVYATPLVAIFAGFWIAAASPALGGIVIFGGIIGLIGGVIYSISTDLAITDKKVLAKWGLISRRTIEQRLSKVDTVQVDQDILGRILNYGSITVTGSGFAPTPIKNIADPLAFRRAVEAAEERGTAEGKNALP